MLKSYRVGEVGLVAHKILETAQSPNSSFPFLFDFGLGNLEWTWACQYSKLFILVQKAKFKKNCR